GRGAAPGRGESPDAADGADVRERPELFRSATFQVAPGTVAGAGFQGNPRHLSVFNYQFGRDHLTTTSRAQIPRPSPPACAWGRFAVHSPASTGPRRYATGGGPFSSSVGAAKCSTARSRSKMTPAARLTRPATWSASVCRVNRVSAARTW